MTVGQTLRTWTVVETIVGVVGLGFVLLLNAFFWPQTDLTADCADDPNQSDISALSA